MARLVGNASYAYNQEFIMLAETAAKYMHIAINDSDSQSFGDLQPAIYFHGLFP